jgi:hypothetical protein
MYREPPPCILKPDLEGRSDDSMERLETTSVHGRSAMLILVLVVAGMAVLGTGGYLAWSKRRAPGEPTSSDATPWCQLRGEWAQKVDPLAGDIMLKSVRPEDKAEAERLVLERNKLCETYARRIRGLKIIDPALQAIEVALIKEGKVRANVAIEVANLEAKLGSEEVAELSKNRETLRTSIISRIKEGKENADREIVAGLAALKSGGCLKIYRGPMTDEGTADSPYTTWDELEMRRVAAMAKFDEAIKKLEPVQEFTNRVYHELVRLYRPTLSGCYSKAKARNSGMSDTVGLRVRLKKSGEVKTLAIEWMDKRDDRLLDCLLEKASKWKLPRPDPRTEMVIVTLDFSKL